MSIKQVRERFYYEFMYRGTRYRGPCTDTNGNPANTLEQAAACENRIKKELGNIRSNRSLKAMIENYREELTGGRKIPLSQAFELSVIKPRKRAPGERRQALKQMHWQDFIEYMAHNFPAVDHLAAVTKTHAENYTYSLLHYGKFEQPDEMGAYDRWEMKLTKQVAPLLKEWWDWSLHPRSGSSR